MTARSESSDLAPLLQSFFTDKLMRQRQASPNTIAAYRDAFTLLLGFASTRTQRQPAQLGLADLDAPTVGAFLQHLQTERGNTAATRNARLAAIHSFFRHALLRAPEHAALIQRVLAIPPKRFDRAILDYLTHAETLALIAAPDLSTWTGRRDHTLLLVAIHTGLRVTELANLRINDAHFGSGAHLRCHGKGRKDRCTPLIRPTAKTVRTWLAERAGEPDNPLFPTRHGTPLSRHTIARLVAKHTNTAKLTCPSLTSKNVTPHTLRHSTAMALLHAGIDISVIALWLGHESSETSMIYLHADMSLKERALARIAPPTTTPGRYTPPDTVLAFLDSL
jgi:site-specific recombinase XerD